MRPAQIAQRATELGVPDEQVARDVLISHALHALLELGIDRLAVFFGGTALCRTHLPAFRLSEDIDLLAADARAVRRRLAGLPALLARQFPDSTLSAWTPAGSTQVAYLESQAGRRVRMHVVPSDASYEHYPTGPTPVQLWYPGLPEFVTLQVPTPTGASAMKLAAWCDRGTPRDLADLHALAERGHLGGAALTAAVEAGVRPTRFDFAPERSPSAEQWQQALGGQMRHPPDLRLAFLTVREAVATTCGWSEAAEFTRELDRYRADRQLDAEVADLRPRPGGRAS